LYDGGSSRGIVNEGKHEKIANDSNKVKASSSNKKPKLKKNNSKVSQVQTPNFQTFIKYKGCVTSEIT